MLYELITQQRDTNQINTVLINPHPSGVHMNEKTTRQINKMEHQNDFTQNY
jgi:hypothetical protein